jgi:hypothetical protein
MKNLSHRQSSQEQQTYTVSPRNQLPLVVVSPPRSPRPKPQPCACVCVCVCVCVFVLWHFSCGLCVYVSLRVCFSMARSLTAYVRNARACADPAMNVYPRVGYPTVDH